MSKNREMNSRCPDKMSDLSAMIFIVKSIVSKWEKQYTFQTGVRFNWSDGVIFPYERKTPNS